MKKLFSLILIASILLPVTASASDVNSPGMGVKLPDGPEFWVHDVERNESVTISLKDFPKDKVYRVLMGDIGNNFGMGIQVGVLARSKREFRATFEIPRWMQNQNLIALVLRDRDTSEQGYVIFQNIDNYNSLQMVSVEPVDQASHQTNGTSVGIFNGPEFWVHSVEKKWKFTLKFNNWRSNDKFKVYVGENNDNFDPIWVGLVYGKKPRSFTQTFDIPSALMNTREIKVMVVSNFTGHSGSTAFMNADDLEVVTPAGEYDWFFISSAIAAKANKGKTPYTQIINVVQDTEVTLTTYSFPEDIDFVVTMGLIGTRGINGIVVGTQNSGDGDSFTVTYPIPGQLKGQDVIAIRFESATTSHFAYDFFHNLDGYSYISDGSESLCGDWVLSPNTYPSTAVNSVSTDTSVTISGFNFTKNDEYKVLMGPIGTKGVGGVQVGTITTADNNTFTETFNIPASLQGQSPIAIRFESVNTDYYAYDYFYNN